MTPGKSLKSVYEAAESFLAAKDGDLAEKLPKRLGFAIGLDFRDPNYVLDNKCTSVFREDMTFCLNLGFQNVELTPEDMANVSTKAASKKLKTFSVLIGDTVKIRDQENPAEVLTVLTKALDDINYIINEKKAQEDNDGDSDVSDVEDNKPGASTGRKSGRLAAIAEDNQDAVADAAEREGAQEKLLR